jgi:AbrB family looped-hinge helix DNA binding protein
MRVTEKGQVTIPKAIRDRLGVGPGSEVDFVERADAVEIVKSEPSGDRAALRQQLSYHIERMRGSVDTGGLDGKAYVDRLRGERDDLDAD